MFLNKSSTDYCDLIGIAECIRPSLIPYKISSIAENTSIKGEKNLNHHPVYHFTDNNQPTSYYRARSGMVYEFLFAYEKKYFDDEYLRINKQWVKNYWSICFVYVFVYLTLIFAGQWYMKSRDKFDMRRGLVAWNLVLALFSTMGSIRLWPEFINAVMTNDLDHAYCSKDFAHGVGGGWTALFAASKFPELLDTFFIIARKQKLIFLHWYHHATVLIYCWYSCQDFNPSARLFAPLNFSVHSVMYSYYACRAMRFNIPRWVSMTITIAQISQMVAGVCANCAIFLKKQRGEDCDVSYDNLKWCLIMYLSYFALFMNFFFKTYRY